MQILLFSHIFLGIATVILASAALLHCFFNSTKSTQIYIAQTLGIATAMSLASGSILYLLSVDMHLATFCKNSLAYIAISFGAVAYTLRKTQTPVKTQPIILSSFASGMAAVVVAIISSAL